MRLKFFSPAIFIILLSFILTLKNQKVLADHCGESVLQLGWFTATQGKSQHINIDGLIGDDFSLDKSSGQNLLFGIGYYFNWMNFSKVSFKYGINAFYLAPTTIKGEVTQESLFTNLSYCYSRTNYPLYLAVKALIPCFRNSDIALDFGIGPNIIRTSDFYERSLDGGITLPDHIFSGKFTAALSATAGLGWRVYNVFGNCPIEIAYRFFYLGQGELKKANNQVKNTLKTGNSYANAFYISISI